MEKLSNFLEELADYALCEDSELGEYIIHLIQDYEHYSSFMPDNLKHALYQELFRQYQFFVTNAVIVEKTVIRTETIRELDWKN